MPADRPGQDELTAKERRVPSVWAAAAAGLAVGLLQALVLAFEFRASRPDPNYTGDPGFGSNPSIDVVAAWLLAFLVVSVGGLAVALARLRVPWYALLVPVLLPVQFAVAGWASTRLPGGDVRVLLLAPILMAETALCQLTVKLITGNTRQWRREPA